MSNRRGFTLIELLIVVVVIGILAAIAIPKFANTKQKAVKSSMISDLRNLATAQEAFFADSSHYATTYGTTIATGQVNVSPSQSNTLVINSASSANGWAATISNPTYAPGSCGIFMGSTFSASGTPAAATQEGVPVCP
ncbi:MAG TPA: prepilin-type N-terminal cleavage/methylation domain-containing protein [Gemmatimonadales bacterium]|jgi:prepilin-type N-terminal cleavage/methylation domain-containing protein|nr:prepilin-type N-terminal cleavage/methylation domain-containing protein [Gemmatimonadales bacterium]